MKILVTRRQALAASSALAFSWGLVRALPVQQKPLNTAEWRQGTSDRHHEEWKTRIRCAG